MSNDTTWEFFCDSSYWDMWAVRPADERRWGCCFHVPSQAEARALSALLTESGAKGFAQPVEQTPVSR